MSLLRRRWIIRNAQNTTIFSACRGRFLLSFSTTTVPERDPSSSVTSSVDCPSSEMVNYLTNSCELSSEAITGICKKLGRRGRAHKARKVINFFRESGFTDTHIRQAISRNPNVLVAKLEKTVMPKVRVFLDWGLSGADVGRIVATRSAIFHVNFEKRVMPVVYKLRDLLPEDEKAVKSIKRFFLASFLRPGLEKHITINLVTLRSHGVSDRSLSIIVERWPHLLGLNPSVFEKMAKKAHELWPHHGSIMFAKAFYTVCSMSEPVWDAKLIGAEGIWMDSGGYTDGFSEGPAFPDDISTQSEAETRVLCGRSQLHICGNCSYPTLADVQLGETSHSPARCDQDVGFERDSQEEEELPDDSAYER